VWVVMGIEETALGVIGKHENGVFQNQLWKELDIDSRKCSRVIAKLLKDGLITRESAVDNGARTFLLKVAHKEEPCFELLLSGDMFSPCAGCRDACQPESCERLTAWVVNLPQEEADKQEASATE
jgi:Lrp/AsnC family transcriptional regulator, leucine-responsive regulatory protein